MKIGAKILKHLVQFRFRTLRKMQCERKSLAVKMKRSRGRLSQQSKSY